MQWYWNSASAVVAVEDLEALVWPLVMDEVDQQYLFGLEAVVGGMSTGRLYQPGMELAEVWASSFLLLLLFFAVPPRLPVSCSLVFPPAIMVLQGRVYPE
jgi:hypothetical protein